MWWRVLVILMVASGDVRADESPCRNMADQLTPGFPNKPLWLRPRVRWLLTRSCITNKWSAEAIACARLTDKKAVLACLHKKLTGEQSDALKQSLRWRSEPARSTRSSISVLPGAIRFVGNTTTVSDESRYLIAAVAQLLLDDKEIEVVQIASDFPRDRPETDRQLAEQRGAAIRRALIGLGVDGARLTTTTARGGRTAIRFKITRHARVPGVGDRLPELTVLRDGEGTQVKLRDYRGSWVVIVVSATWCKHCMRAVGVVDRAGGGTGAKVKFVVVDVSGEKDLAATGEQYAKLGLTRWRVLHTPKPVSLDPFGGEAIPNTLVVDPEGTIRFARTGYYRRAGDADGLARTLAKLPR